MSTIKLGWGEYQLGTERAKELGCEPESVEVSRLLFLLAVLALRLDVTAEFIRMSAALSESLPKPWNDLEGFVAALPGVKEQIKSYCNKNGLCDFWFWDLAALYVASSRWREPSGGSEFFKLCGPEITEIVNAENHPFNPLANRRLIIEFNCWDPTKMTRREFVERAERQFKSKLKHYLDGRESDAVEMGLVKTPERREIEKYLWLAGFQTLGWSAAKIADAENKERRTVEEQINKLALEIDLTLRERSGYDQTVKVEAIRESLRAARQLFFPFEHQIENLELLPVREFLLPILRSILMPDPGD